MEHTLNKYWNKWAKKKFSLSFFFGEMQFLNRIQALRFCGRIEKFDPKVSEPWWQNANEFSPFSICSFFVFRKCNPRIQEVCQAKVTVFFSFVSFFKFQASHATFWFLNSLAKIIQSSSWMWNERTGWRETNNWKIILKNFCHVIYTTWMNPQSLHSAWAMELMVKWDVPFSEMKTSEKKTTNIGFQFVFLTYKNRVSFTV